MGRGGGGFFFASGGPPRGGGGGGGGLYFCIRGTPPRGRGRGGERVWGRCLLGCCSGFTHHSERYVERFTVVTPWCSGKKSWSVRTTYPLRYASEKTSGPTQITSCLLHFTSQNNLGPKTRKEEAFSALTSHGWSFHMGILGPEHIHSLCSRGRCGLQRRGTDLSSGAGRGGGGGGGGWKASPPCRRWPANSPGCTAR